MLESLILLYNINWLDVLCGTDMNAIVDKFHTYLYEAIKMCVPLKNKRQHLPKIV